MSDSTTQGTPGWQPARGGGIDRDAVLRARLEAMRLNAGGTAVDAHASSPRLDPSSGVSGTQRPGRGGSTAEVRPAGARRYSRTYVNENVRAMDNGLPFTSADQFNYGITAADYARLRRAASAPNVVVTTPAPAPFPAAPDVPMVGTMPEVGHVAYITVQTPEGRFYTVRVDLSNAAPRAVYNFVINIDAFP
ncbi:hypothetical protein Daus18300_006312 [Diaporthe australafricana]|uniref:Uncharacterized protein n=1 Tax=Diaporthe australafricana TaxID=127596 RepID=A0ABR3WUW5_9PEZI